MLKTNFNSFKKQLDKEIEKQQELQKDEFKAIVFTCFNTVTKLSPVLTGYFRTNNLISANTSTSAILPEGTIESESTILSDGRSSINSVKVKNNTSIFIQNNLPYVERIENGYSQKAPAGVYRVAEEATRRSIAKTQREVIK